MKVIAFINQKGGVGKSTLALHMASYLKSINKSVLTIDLDSQGNLTQAFGVDTTDKVTIREILTGENAINEGVFGTQYGYLIPSDLTLGHSERQIAGAWCCETLLKSALDPFLEVLSKSGKSIDYVLIDCPPAFNVFTYNALTVATDVILPCRAEQWSFDALTQFLVIKSQVEKSFKHKINIAGVVINMFQSNINTQKVYVERFKDFCNENNMPLINQTIRQSTDVNTAIANSKSVFDFKPSSLSSKDIKTALEEILGNVKGDNK